MSPHPLPLDEFRHAFRTLLRGDATTLLVRCRSTLKSMFPFEHAAIEHFYPEPDAPAPHQPGAQNAAFKAFLAVALPVEALRAYSDMCPAKADVVAIRIEQYEYLFDLSLERVAFVCGRSWSSDAARDRTYMREFLGKARSASAVKRATAGLSGAAAAARERAATQSWRERFFEACGGAYDRGHFMSLRQGGGYDMNLFPQLAAVNSGHGRWGEYRVMENECAKKPGTFCFSRPIYTDETWIPCEIEYGYAHSVDDMRTARFPNRP
jgi:hypothetical protein